MQGIVLLLCSIDLRFKGDNVAKGKRIKNRPLTAVNQNQYDTTLLKEQVRAQQEHIHQISNVLAAAMLVLAGENIPDYRIHLTETNLMDSEKYNVVIMKNPIEPGEFLLKLAEKTEGKVL
jgi:hypothetical protein